MSDNLTKLIIESVKDQKEIFGDDLFEQVDFAPVNVPVFDEPDFTTTDRVELKKTNNYVEEEFQKAESLDELYKKIHTCVKCPLGHTRTKFVFGVGNPHADALLIGEAPGADEDKQGEPFVGRAGKLLNDILKAINFNREEVYIANILKCRPPGNRDPKPDEIDLCRPYLNKQLELIKPKIILCLGRIAANSLLDKKLSLTMLRENIYEYNGIKVMATYHPAALLRNPGWKRGCWEDVQKFRKLYDELIADK